MSLDNSKYKKNIVDKFKLAIVPVLIVLVSVMLVGGAVFYASKNILENHKREDKTRFAMHVARHSEEWEYENIVNKMYVEEDLEYVAFLDEGLNIIAQAKRDSVDISYKGDDMLESALGSVAMSREIERRGSRARILEIAVPVYDSGKTAGLFVMGVSMESIYNSLYGNLAVAVQAMILVFAVFLYIHNKNVIRPARVLSENLKNIDLEKSTKYRLPAMRGDTFYGLANSINGILEKADRYFEELRDNKDELNVSNDELSSALGQLTASEEELRAQYDEIQKYADQLEELKKKYEIAIDATGSAVWEVEIEGETMFVSEDFNSIAGTGVNDRRGIYEVISQLDIQKGEQDLINEYRDCKSGISDEMDCRIKINGGDGNSKWLLVRGRRIDSSGGRAGVVSGIIVDITQFKRQEEYIEYLAYHDHLTSIPNRRGFMKELEKSLALGQKGAVILLDIDNFKGINDTMGHAYGDMVLQKVARTIKNVNPQILVSRFGGDEFLIMVPGESDAVRIEEYAKDIARMFESKFEIAEKEIYINFSMGITMYPIDGRDTERILINADTAMYSVKNSGKNGYMFFHGDMTKELEDKVEIERILRNALDEDGFELAYQPQVNVNTGMADGFEALLRLRHHRISPGVFIPVAEESGIISDIGKWVTRKAICQMKEWAESGFEEKSLAINISTKQLNGEGYVDFLEETINKSGINPRNLEIEITESVLLERTQETIRILEKLKNIGVSIALDDFGTGYSSLSYLTFIPVDKIKLDKSLNDKFLEEDTIKVMDSLISLAHSLDLKVTAEGIEEWEQYRRLKKGGCDYIQGYLFSRPVSSEVIEDNYGLNYIDYVGQNRN